MQEYPYRLQSSSYLGLPYRILNKFNPKKELLWSLWVVAGYVTKVFLWLRAFAAVVLMRLLLLLPWL